MPDTPATPRLFLVDGYALIYRAFFALINRPLTTSKGENTSIAWGIANFLTRLLKQHRPEYLGWVHDAGASFRDELYPDYKATREKLADDLQADFDRGIEHVCRMLDAYGIPVLAREGYEADDVIGTLAHKGVAAGLEVVVVSGDKDFHQLVRPGVKLLNPGRGGPASVDEHWVSVDNGSERLGIPPERTIDYLALVGDASDNVPGVPGIGEKTAVELITTYGDLDAILAHAAEIPKKRPREALLAHADKALLSRTLVTIHTDAPVDLDLDTLRFHAPDVARLRQVYVDLEFGSLARALGEGADAPSTATAEGDALAVEPAALPPDDPRLSFDVEEHPLAHVPLRYTTVTTTAQLATCVARCREVGMIAFDTETVLDEGAPGTVNAQRSSLVAISLATAAGEAWYLPFAHRVAGAAQGDLLAGDTVPAIEPAPENLPPLLDAACAELRAMLEDTTVRKTAQHAKYDLLVLRRAGVELRGLDFDPMLASYVLDPGRRSHGLDALALEVFGHRMVSYEEVAGKGKAQVGFDRVPVDRAAYYSCEDADYTLRLRLHFAPLVEASGMATLFRDVEMPLVCVLEDMEWAGIAVDVEHFASLKARFAGERQRVEREIFEAAGEEFNVNSNPQLRRILFEKLQLPIRKKTATGPSTDASVLQELADEGHVLPGLLMEYRELFKLEGTYLDALPQLVDPRDGRIHTTFNQTVAQTGRLSSSDPNLQNIPIRRELGRAIRKGFVAPPGALLFGADYSQIELRLLAHLSQDPAFVSAFNAGGDIHRQTGAVIFGVPVEQVTPEMRARAKTINFATIYGQGPRALSLQLKIAFAEAKGFIEMYFERFAGIRAYLDRQVQLARETGYVETIFGRRRYVPELKDRNFNVRAFGERVAQNAPIQGSAADLIKIAMLRIAERLKHEGEGARMLLQVHDELVFEVPEGALEAVRTLVVHEMTHAATLSVPLVVETGAGRDWLSAK
ncbi:MAG: DNA polymerase I [Gemmatimonadaceae bacterium]|nr:DNA polymerase I [Gemmatimonadaceae bacterium]